MSDQNPPAPPTQRPYADHPLRPDIPQQREQTFDHPHAPSGPYGEVSPPYPPPIEPAFDEPYARWWQRVLATLIDGLLLLPFGVVIIVGIVVVGDTTTVFKGPDGTITSVDTSGGTWAGVAVTGAAYLAMLVFGIWNGIVRQGRRGASIGKQCLHLMVVSESDGRPIGALMTFVRQLVHLLDQIPLYLGYLWPLWDRKRQTFADMVMKTAVLHLPPLPRQAPPTQVPQQAGPPYGR